MSSDKSNSQGKVVVKEEPSQVDAEPEIWLVKKVKGSSSLAPSQPIAEGATAPAPPAANIPGAQQHGDSRSAFLKHLIMHCVVALGTGNVTAANTALQSISSIATTVGDTLQRVAFAFAEALARRAMRFLPGLAWALQLQVPPPLTTPVATDIVRQSFAAMCPLLRVAATAANHAILSAMEAERAVHVVDLGGACPNQWLDLLRLFAARSGGPPTLRLTIVNEQDDFLSRAAGVLTQEAVRLHVPFVFNPVRSHIDRFAPPNVAALGVVHGQGEAVVITSTLQLHRLIADEVTIVLPAAAAAHNNDLEQVTSHKITKADALLRVVRDLMPKLLVLTEQEADHNGANLSDRVQNALDYYMALFRDLEAAAGGDPRRSVDRVAVERVLLREEVMDIVAGDGVLRRERHEKFACWELRMQVAGFEPVPVSINVFKETRKLARQMSGDGGLCLYRARKVDKGCLFLYSRRVPIFSVSAWRPVH